jgi:hypothetical protein
MGLYEKPRVLLDFELFLKAKSHEPCLQARGPAGSRSTMDRSRGAAVGSLELVLGAAPLNGCLPRIEEKGEELWGVLSVGKSGRRVDGVRPVAVNRGGS